jgi:hypothetical protein
LNKLRWRTACASLVAMPGMAVPSKQGAVTRTFAILKVGAGHVRDMANQGNFLADIGEFLKRLLWNASQ